VLKSKKTRGPLHYKMKVTLSKQRLENDHSSRNIFLFFRSALQFGSSHTTSAFSLNVFLMFLHCQHMHVILCNQIKLRGNGFNLEGRMKPSCFWFTKHLKNSGFCYGSIRVLFFFFFILFRGEMFFELVFMY